MASSPTSLDRERSALMLKLNAQALATARAKVASKFNTAADLEDFTGYLVQTQKANVQADTQLSLAVQAKLEALKRAKDIMDESSAKLNTLFTSIKKTDEKINLTNTEITKYDYLCRINNAKENMERVLSQVEYFRNVPKKVAKLNEMLDSEPARLKEVFKEALQLDALRQALLKEVKSSGGGASAARRQEAAASNTKGAKGSYSEESYKRVNDMLEKHLKMIPDLMKRIRGQIYGYVDRFMEVGLDSPQDLVMAFEIVEMHQEYLDRRRDQNRERAIALNNLKKTSAGGKDYKFTDPETFANENYEDFAEEIKQRVHQVLIDKINVRFEVIKSAPEERGDKGDKDQSNVMAILHGATQLMSMMTEFKNEISPCFPPEYDCMAMLSNAVEDHIVPEITNLVGKSKTEKLDVGDILKLMDWIEYYIAQMISFEQSSSASVNDFKYISDELKQEYVTRVKTQVTIWFENINKRPKEIIKTQENLLISSHPEDMFNCMFSQVNVAKDKLPRTHMGSVINACLTALRDTQRDTIRELDEEWKDKYDAESLCALINDSDRMMQKGDEFGAFSLGLMDPYDTILVAVEAAVEAATDEYANIAVKAVTVLGRCILLDLDDAVFSKLYTAEWETGTRLTETLTATLDDYLNDISGWISSTYFAKLITHIFTISIDLYCMSIRKVSNGLFHFMNELVATGMVVQDNQIILDYFTKWESHLRGLGMPLAQALAPMSTVATLISATRLAELEEHAPILFFRWGIDGLKLVNSIILANPVLSKGEKTHFSEKMGKAFDSGTYETEPNPLFEGFDTVNLDSKKPEEQKKSRFNFWSKS